MSALSSCPSSLSVAAVALDGQMRDRGVVFWSVGYEDSCCEDHDASVPDDLDDAAGGELNEVLVHAWVAAAAPTDDDLPQIPYCTTVWHTVTGALWQSLHPTGHWEVGFDEALTWAADHTVDPVALVWSMASVLMDRECTGVRCNPAQAEATLTIGDDPQRLAHVRRLTSPEVTDLVCAAVAAL